MPLPMTKVSKSFVDRLFRSAQADPTNPMQVPMPSYGPRTGPEALHPDEKKRRQQIAQMLTGPTGLIVNYAYGQEEPGYAMAMLQEVVNKIPEAARPVVHRPREVSESIFQNFKYGLVPESGRDIEHWLVGAVPAAMVQMAYAGRVRGVDPFARDLLYHEDKTPEDQSMALLEWMYENKIFVANAPPAHLEASGFGPQWQQEVQAAVPLSNVKPMIDQGLWTPTNPRTNQPNPMVIGDLSWGRVLSAYMKFGTEEWQPMRDYATDLANLVDEDRLTRRLFFGQQGIPDVSMATKMSSGGRPPSFDAAASLFFAGKPVRKGAEIICIDIGELGSNAFDSEKSGQLSDEFRNLLFTIDNYSRRQRRVGDQPTKAVRERRKIILLSPNPIKANVQQGKPPSQLDNVQYFEPTRPSLEELKHFKVPWLLNENFGPKGHYLLVDETEAGLQNRDPNSADVQNQMARYMQGLSFKKVNDFFLELLTNYNDSQHWIQLEGQGRFYVPFSDFLSKMREHYVEYLMTGDLAQVKEQFRIIDPNQKAGKGMVQTKQLAKILQNVQEAKVLSDTIQGVSDASGEIQDLKEAIGSIGLTPPELMYDHEAWAGEDNMERLKNRLKEVVKRKKIHFLFMKGPAGMGKTSTGAMIAKALDFGYLTWTLARTENSLVGVSEENLQKAFQTIATLRDYVILLDEVDGALEPPGGLPGHPTKGTTTALFKAFWTEIVEPAAPANDLIFISTTNHPEKFEEAMQRRLGADGTMELKPLTRRDELRNMVDFVVSNYSQGNRLVDNPDVRGAFSDALFKEANTEGKGAFTNDEITKVFNHWIRMSMGIPGMMRAKEIDLPEQYMRNPYDPDFLRFIVQRAPRQTMGQGLNVGIEMLYEFASRHKPFAKPKEEGEATPDQPLPEQMTIPGFSPAKPSPGPLLSSPGGPTPVPEPQASPPPGKPPLAKDVNVERESRGAEESLSPKARAPRKAGNEISLLKVATTPGDLEQGLQFVKELPEMSGMLFDFGAPRVLNFWMKNTYVPLDIAFIDDEDVVVKTERMIPLSTRTVSSGRPCVMALEVPAGTLSRVGCEVGKRLVVDRESRTARFDDRRAP